VHEAHSTQRLEPHPCRRLFHTLIPRFPPQFTLKRKGTNFSCFVPSLYFHGFDVYNSVGRLLHR